MITGHMWTQWVSPLLIGGLFLLVFIAVMMIFKLKRAWPYSKRSVMTNVEKKFFVLLKETFPDYHILAQVQLSRLIEPTDRKNQWKWLNKIIRMSVDYVVLDHRLDTLVVIELDDKTHQLPKRKEADNRKNRALKAAGVRLIRFHVTHMPSRHQLLELVNSK